MMKEYFVVLISMVFAGGILISLTPPGSFQKYMRFLCGIAVSGCIMMPLLSGEVFEKTYIGDWDKYWDSENDVMLNYDEIYNSSLKHASAKNAEEYIKSLVTKEIKAQKGDIDIRVITSEKSEEICIERIEVIIYPSGINLDPRKIQNIVYELLECECIIMYK